MSFSSGGLLHRGSGECRLAGRTGELSARFLDFTAEINRPAKRFPAAQQFQDPKLS